ncbi:putative rhamnosyl transferase [Parasedimentitalea maritima]|uniref:Rhamnosyl transferase n=1 Tax=Parasedimentitalea maritima TaxID=2578117 RepID=A0A6A4R966_9RHOB|nr:putative rhamnosyl transferase [Zongyanglinia marina]KAE9628879.1 hypothetical protein GP644_14015 [Zongyanglinia marina]
MQVIGLCRFSYPAIGGFQVIHETTEDRIGFLYNEERLMERFQLFETIALPCLRAQTDQQFDLVVVIGDSLPKHHADRLRDLCADIPQIRIHAEPPRRQREVMKEVLNTARRDPSQPCIQFRHDDDDAVSVDFVERLRQTVIDCPGLVDRNPTVAIDFNRGFIAEVGASGMAAAATMKPYNVAALGMYVQGGSAKTIMNFAHNKLNQFMPTVTITDAPMWLRTHNQYNDSRQSGAHVVDVTPVTPELAGEIAARFAIEPDHIRRVFSAL